MPSTDPRTERRIAEHYSTEQGARRIDRFSASGHACVFDHLPSSCQNLLWFSDFLADFQLIAVDCVIISLGKHEEHSSIHFDALQWRISLKNVEKLGVDCGLLAWLVLTGNAVPDLFLPVLTVRSGAPSVSLSLRSPSCRCKQREYALFVLCSVLDIHTFGIVLPQVTFLTRLTIHKG